MRWGKPYSVASEICLCHGHSIVQTHVCDLNDSTCSITHLAYLLLKKIKIVDTYLEWKEAGKSHIKIYLKEN